MPTPDIFYRVPSTPTRYWSVKVEDGGNKAQTLSGITAVHWTFYPAAALGVKRPLPGSPALLTINGDFTAGTDGFTRLRCKPSGPDITALGVGDVVGIVEVDYTDGTEDFLPDPDWMLLRGTSATS